MFSADSTKDLIIYFLQKAGILFGFSAVSFTMFGYALLNFPAAARPFVYMHWVRYPWLKFEEPSVRACFGFFKGIMRTKYIPMQSPYTGLAVPGWVTSPETESSIDTKETPNSAESLPPIDIGENNAVQLQFDSTGSSKSGPTIQLEKECRKVLNNLPRPESLFSQDQRPIVIYFHGNCSNRGEPHRIDLYNFLSSLSFPAPPSATMVMKNHDDGNTDVQVHCNPQFFPPSEQFLSPVDVSNNADTSTSTSTSTPPPSTSYISQTFQNITSIVGGISSLVQNITTLNFSSSQEGSTEKTSETKLLSAPNAHVISFDYRGFGDNISSNHQKIHQRAVHYNRHHGSAKKSSNPPSPTSSTTNNAQHTATTKSQKNGAKIGIHKSSPSGTHSRTPSGVFSRQSASDHSFSPSPSVLLEDALAVWDWLTTRCQVSGERIFIFSHSLGTGVAAKFVHQLTDRLVSRVVVERKKAFRFKELTTQLSTVPLSAGSTLATGEDGEECKLQSINDEAAFSCRSQSMYPLSFNPYDLIPAGVIVESPFLSAPDVAMSIPIVNLITKTACSLGIPMRKIIRRGLKAHAFDSLAHWNCALRNCEKTNVHFPVLVLHGKMDAVVPVTHGESLFRYISNTKNTYRDVYKSLHVAAQQDEKPLTGDFIPLINTEKFSHPFKPASETSSNIHNPTDPIDSQVHHAKTTRLSKYDSDCFENTEDTHPLLQTTASECDETSTKRQQTTDNDPLLLSKVFAYEHISDDMIADCISNVATPKEALMDPIPSYQCEYTMPDHGDVAFISCVPLEAVTLHPNSYSNEVHESGVNSQKKTEKHPPAQQVIGITSSQHSSFQQRDSVALLTVHRAFHDNLIHYDAVKIAVTSFIRASYRNAKLRDEVSVDEREVLGTSKNNFE